VHMESYLTAPEYRRRAEVAKQLAETAEDPTLKRHLGAQAANFVALTARAEREAP
jgi:hypothetical protein